MKLTEYKVKNLTQKILDKLDRKNIVSFETGGRMGMDRAWFYYLDDENFVRYEIDDGNIQLDPILRREFLNTDFENGFNVVDCGFGNRFFWRKDCELKLDDNFFIFNERYKIDVSVPAICNHVQKWLDQNREQGPRLKGKLTIADTEAEFSIAYSELCDFLDWREELISDKTTKEYSRNDPIVRKAVEICLSKGFFSTSLLQTYLEKGHGFITGLGIWLAENGIIGAANDHGPQKMLISSMDEFDEKMGKN